MLIGMRAYLRDFALRPAVQIGFTSSGKETSGCENWLFCDLRVKYPQQKSRASSIRAGLEYIRHVSLDAVGIILRLILYTREGISRLDAGIANPLIQQHGTGQRTQRKSDGHDEDDIGNKLVTINFDLQKSPYDTSIAGSLKQMLPYLNLTRFTQSFIDLRKSTP